jgi:hypothetical protein
VPWFRLPGASLQCFTIYFVIIIYYHRGRRCVNSVKVDTLPEPGSITASSVTGINNHHQRGPQHNKIERTLSFRQSNELIFIRRGMSAYSFRCDPHFDKAHHPQQIRRLEVAFLIRALKSIKRGASNVHLPPPTSSCT